MFEDSTADSKFINITQVFLEPIDIFLGPEAEALFYFQNWRQEGMKFIVENLNKAFDSIG